MTRYARANGSKSCNARVSADPTPWSEMVSPNKRAADSIEDDDVTTPKKEKKTPKKTPKVVKLEPGTPKSLAVLKSPVHETSPLLATTSAKKAKKTPLKQKAMETPKNCNTPPAGKLSQPSPVQTRSARRKKAEANAMVGTPNSVGVTPSKNVKGTNLTSHTTPKITPKIQKSTPNTKGRKINKEEEFKLKLDDEEMDSDDLDSDNNMGDNDSDDIASDDEPLDEEQTERLKAELHSIINKPVSCKSILKTTKIPIKVAKTEEAITTQTALISQTSPKKSVAKEIDETEETEVKSPISNKNARHSIKAVAVEAADKDIAEKFAKSPQAQKTPSKKTKVQASPVKSKEEAASTKTPAENFQVKTPFKETSAPLETPVKSTEVPAPVKSPAKTKETTAPVELKEVLTPVEIPIKDTSAVKTPAKKDTSAVKTPAKKDTSAVKTPAKKVTSAVKTPAKKDTSAVTTPAITEETITPVESSEVPVPVETLAKNNTNTKKTPAKKDASVVKTPAKSKETVAPVETPVELKEVLTPVEIPAKKDTSAVKTPAKKDTSAVKTPAKKDTSAVKTPAKKVTSAVKTPAKKDTPAVSTPAITEETIAPVETKEVPTPVEIPAKDTSAVKTPAKKDTSAVKTRAITEETIASVESLEIPLPVETVAKNNTSTNKTPAKKDASTDKTPAKTKETVVPVETLVESKEIPVSVETLSKDISPVKTSAETKKASVPVENPLDTIKTKILVTNMKLQKCKELRAARSKANQLLAQTTNEASGLVGTPSGTLPVKITTNNGLKARMLARKLARLKRRQTALELKTALSKENELLLETSTEASAPIGTSSETLPAENAPGDAKKSKMLAKKLKLEKKKLKAAQSKENRSPKQIMEISEKTEVPTKEMKAEDSGDTKAAKLLAKKLKWEQKKAQKKEMKAVDSDKAPLIDIIKHPSSRPISSVKKNKADLALEERYAEVRKKLVTSDKTDEEINQELPKIMEAIKNRTMNSRCLRCRQNGHLQSDCPNSNTSLPKKCYKCGDATHNVKDCSIKEDVFTYADCFVCKKTGHLSRNCPSNKNGIFPHGGSCFKCGDKSHISKFCPGAKRAREDENETSEIIHKKTFVGVLNSKQSADADVTDSVVKTQFKAMKQGNKKRVVKF